MVGCLHIRSLELRNYLRLPGNRNCLKQVLHSSLRPLRLVPHSSLRLLENLEHCSLKKRALKKTHPVLSLFLSGGLGNQNEKNKVLLLEVSWRVWVLGKLNQDFHQIFGIYDSKVELAKGLAKLWKIIKYVKYLAKKRKNHCLIHSTNYHNHLLAYSALGTKKKKSDFG